MPTLVHDLGYGLKSVLWQEKEAVNHAEKGAGVMERFRRRGLRNLLAEDDEHARKSLTTLETHASLYHDTLAANSKALLAYANECAKREEIPLVSLFPLIVMVADKLDYFRAKRVDAIPAPHRYEDNPYYFLADAVDPYTLTDEQDVLHYSVQLKDHYHLPAENGLLPLHFAMWQNQTAQHFSTVWQLTSSFAHLVGKRLCVTHNQSVRPLTSIAAPEWDDRYDAGSSEAEPCHSRLAQEEAA